jgi:hypothetical protein
MYPGTLSSWSELRDGAHARSRQAFRPVQSIHQSSSRRVDSRVRYRHFVATAKREFGRFVLSAPVSFDGTTGFVVEACA